MRRLLSNPGAIGLAVVILLAARWIWVAGLGDYAWEYEVAARILRGEIFFRDFPLLRGPLSYYTLAALIHAFGGHLFAYHVHLWLSYALSLGAGLLVARELGATRPVLIAGVSLAAIIACPVVSWGHSLDYLSVCLAGIGIVCTLRALRGSHWWAAAAGTAAALTIFQKQNVGIAIAMMIPIFLHRKGRGHYLLGLSSLFLVIFGYFSFGAGAGEVWWQLFMDAARSKPGGLAAALRAVPRLVFRPDLAMRRWWELAATAAAYAVLLALVIRLARRQAGVSREDQSGSGMGLACLAGAGAGIILSLARLSLDWPQAPLIHPWALLLELTYILFFLLGATCIFKSWDRNWTAALVLVLAVTAAQEASNPNFVYSAALVIPLLCATFSRMHGAMPSRSVGITVAAVYLLATTVIGPNAFYGLCAYQPTYPLPADSPFRGLRAPKAYAARVEEIWREVRPIVQQRRTLWLLGGGGPYLAYGGRSVFNAPYFRPDAFSARFDQSFVESWQKTPPDVVLLSDDFRAFPNRDLLTAGYIKAHVLAGYKLVWRSKVYPALGVWIRPPRGDGQEALLRLKEGQP